MLLKTGLPRQIFFEKLLQIRKIHMGGEMGKELEEV